MIPRRALAPAAVVFAAALSACAPSTQLASTSPSPTREAAAQACPDLAGPSDLPSYFDFNTKFGVNVTFDNATGRTWRLEVPPVDCYDFSGTSNPTRFDGAVLNPNSQSGPHQLVARRVCPWVSGTIIGYFQTREAKWTTTFVEQGGSGTRFSVPSVIVCSTYTKTTPTMCETGVQQDKDVRIFDLTDGGAIRLITTCDESGASIRMEQLY